MEHRWSVRKRIKAPVRIDCPDLGPVAATLRDVGLGGMCVKTGTRALPLYRIVRTSFTLPHDARGDEFHAEALVVRSQEGRAGLMFVGASPDQTDRLRRALYEAPVVAGRDRPPIGPAYGNAGTAAGEPQTGTNG